MALKAELEELLKVMKPEDQEPARKMLEAYPQLADGWLRQADYSRQVAEARAARDKADKKYQENVEWWNQKKPIYDEYERENQALKEEAVRLKAAVESASKTAIAGAGGDGSTANIADVTKAVLDQMTATGGRFSQGDIEKIAEAKAKSLLDGTLTEKITSGITAASDQFLTKTFPAVTQTLLDFMDISFQHQSEFGKPLDRKALSDYMAANKIVSPKEAYDKMNAQVRMDKEIDRRAAERAQQMFTERMGMPGSGAPGATPPGPFQIRLSDDAKVDPMAGKDVKVGAGELARAAAAELVAEGRV